MHLNWLAWAVPVFCLFMYIEYAVARRQGKGTHGLHNSISNVSIGIAERLLDLFVVGSFFTFYRYLEQNFGVFDIKPSLLLWVLLFICTDFVWYWYHRLAHEINLFWAAHVVHHQSEDLNYTVSARITVFQAVLRTGFWSLLPILGFPAEMISTVLLVHGAYPFFIHTQTIGKLGILEYIFVTPSHHRVHHASNDEYLDKNYGDVLIIWDKLFGTFKREEDDVEMQFGLTHPLRTRSFLWQHFHFFAELLYEMRVATGVRSKLKILFGRPQHVRSDARARLERIFLKSSVQSPEVGARLNRYVLWQMAIALISLFALILLEHHLSVTHQAVVAILIILTLINCGAILEQRRWVYYLEVVRIHVALLPTMIYLSNPLTIVAVICLTIMLALPAYFRKRYDRFVYGA
jgi:alkylglycerol monooxygenase